MKIDFLSDTRRTLDHMLPIYNALPKSMQGMLVQSGRVQRLRKRTYPVVVANPKTWRAVTRRTPEKPVIIMGHDCGDVWGRGNGQHPSYLRPKEQIDNVALFLACGEHIATAQRERYPDTPVAVIGCPKLDRWHTKPPQPRNDKPVVAISFTWWWQSKISTFPQGAWTHYRGVLKQLGRLPQWTVVGNAHPKAQHRLTSEFNAAGMKQESFAWCMEHADIYVCDYSSTIFEFASIGRPVVLMNAPWYREQPDIGLRFWHCADVGINVWEPDELIPAIDAALADTPEQREKRKQAVDYIYPVQKTAARAAARAIIDAVS